MNEHLRDILKKTDVEYAEIRLEETLNTRIAFTGVDLEDCSENVSFGGNVRVLHKGAWGFTTFNSVNEIETKLKVAIGHARIMGERRNEPFKLAEVPVIDIGIPLEVKKNPVDVPLNWKVEIMREYNSLALDFDERITTTNSRYFDKKLKLTFVNSEGTAVVRHAVDLGFVVMSIVRNHEGSFFAYTMTGSSDDFNVVLNQEDKVKKTAGDSILIADSKPVKGGEYTVILDPMLAGVFIHEAFGHLSEGDNVYEDPNLQKIMVLGREFGNSNLNVVDSGLERGQRGYLPYDDEGVKTQRNYLIKDGKLVGRLHSRETATKMGESPTGNARAITYQHPPIPRMRTTMIEPGNVPFEEMVRNTKKGLYCISSRGGQTNGELFTFTAADAFMIKDGKLAERVRDVTLTGNVFETLKNIDMIGNDYMAEDGPGGCGKRGQMPLPTSEGSPHIRIQNVVVGGQ
ncbi:TldD/PmbA family protein [bacterium]|nr:TldD/PmbA family protein [bacterium]MBU1024921.1 TldD/PmbA family protein [bacterium]